MYNLLGLYKVNKIPMDKLFEPKFSKVYLQGLWNTRTSNGDLYIKSLNNDVVYWFKGVESEEEMCYAILYVYIKDRKSKGTYTAAASKGKAVYSHSSAEHVRHWVESVPFDYGL